MPARTSQRLGGNLAWYSLFVQQPLPQFRRRIAPRLGGGTRAGPRFDGFHGLPVIPVQCLGFGHKPEDGGVLALRHSSANREAKRGGIISQAGNGARARILQLTHRCRRANQMRLVTFGSRGNGRRGSHGSQRLLAQQAVHLRDVEGPKFVPPRHRVAKFPAHLLVRLDNLAGGG